MAENTLLIRIKTALENAGAKKAAEDIKALRAEGVRAGTALNGSFSKTRAGLESISRQLETTKRQVVGFYAAFQAGQAALAAGRGVFEAAAKFEGLATAMKTLRGSAQAGAEAMAFARDESRRLGLRIEDTTESFVGLVAASNGIENGFEMAKRVFTGISTAGAVLRLSNEKLKLSFQAVTQIMSKGQVTAEELRGQLGESLYGAFQTAARAIGVSSADLNKALEQGLLKSSGFLAAFAAQLEKDYAGGVAEASNSATAKLNQFQNAVLDMKLKLANSGVLDGIVKSLEAMTRVLSDPATQAGLKSFGEFVGNSLRFIAQNFRQITAVLAGLVGLKLGISLGAALGPIGALVGAVGGLAAGFVAADMAMAKFGKGAQAAADPVARLQARATALAKSIGALNALRAKSDAKSRGVIDSQIARQQTELNAVGKQLAALAGSAKPAVDFGPAFGTPDKKTGGANKAAQAALREAERLAQARLELEETLAAQADRLAEDSIRRDIALNKEAFDAKRIEAEAYYARLVGLQVTLAAAEIAALERQRNAAAQAAAEAAKRGDQADVLKASGEVAKLNTDIELARLKLDDFRREAAAGLAEAQADRLKTQFAAIEKKIDAQLTALRDKEQTLRNQVALGLPQAAAEAQINAARRATLATTAALVDKLAELARLNPQLFGEEAAAQIERYRAGLADLNVVADSVATRINSAVSTAFEKLFADIGSGAATAKDALLGFLRAVVGEINEVVGKNLAQSILGSILPTGQAGATGGLGGFVSGILGGGGTGKPDGTAANPVYTLSREPLKLDAAGVGGDGGLFGGLRAQLSTLFDGLKSGFTTLFSGLGNALSGLFSGGGGFLSALGDFFGLGFASGGMVSGPGTSTSDSIPARLSAGEYVIRAAAVRRVGVAFLDAINGIKAPPAWNAGRLAFAAGGMVPAVAAQAAPVVNSSTRIVNLFDPSQVAGELGKTREFERAVLNVIQLNPRALQGGF